jgi:hypothetical protein
MRESKIEKAFVEGVEALGGTADKVRDLLRRGRPDREVVWPAGHRNAVDTFTRENVDGNRVMFAGNTVPLVEFAELKTIGGKLESWQQRYHDRLRAQGFPVRVLWTMEQVEEYLRSRGKQ